jgi:NAD(P)-dependent dehydrogenase (short-subunit alcohol dehydrogenase family)
VQLRDKTVVVTGAARGIGRECAVRFAAEGADLVLLDVARDLPNVGYPLGRRCQLDDTAALCEQHGSAVIAFEVDVRDLSQIESAIASAIERFGSLDVLVNNAGLVGSSGAELAEVSESEWAMVIDVNLTGAWRMIRTVAPFMIKQRSGSIVNIASTAGLVGYRRSGAYVTAKHGLIGLTRAAALDYGPFRVRANALCPGSVRDDPLVEGRMLAEIARSLDIPVEEHERIFVRDQPMNALIEPADVAGAALWLAGDDSRQVTGSVVTVDGGFTSR